MHLTVYSRHSVGNRCVRLLTRPFAQSTRVARKGPPAGGPSFASTFRRLRRSFASPSLEERGGCRRQPTPVSIARCNTVVKSSRDV